MLASTSALSSKACIAQRPQAFGAARPAVRAAQPALTVASAKTKASALRAEFTTSEAIVEEVQRLKVELFAQRIKFAKREEYKPSMYKEMRKRVAQLMTIKREQEILAGIDKRDARAIEKRQLTEAGLGRF